MPRYYKITRKGVVIIELVNFPQFTEKRFKHTVKPVDLSGWTKKEKARIAEQIFAKKSAGAEPDVVIDCAGKTISEIEDEIDKAMPK